MSESTSDCWWDPLVTRRTSLGAAVLGLCSPVIKTTEPIVSVSVGAPASGASIAMSSGTLIGGSVVQTGCAARCALGAPAVETAKAFEVSVANMHTKLAYISVGKVPPGMHPDILLMDTPAQRAQYVATVCNFVQQKSEHVLARLKTIPNPSPELKRHIAKLQKQVDDGHRLKQSIMGIVVQRRMELLEALYSDFLREDCMAWQAGETERILDTFLNFLQKQNESSHAPKFMDTMCA